MVEAQERNITVDGYKVRYLEAGKENQTVLILIHGLGASADRWDQSIPILKKQYHLYVPDLIGFGYSDKPNTEYTVEFFSDFVSKFITALKIECCFVVGSSLGGQILIDLAIRQEPKIKSAVVVSPSGFSDRATPSLDAYIMAALYPTKATAEEAYQMMAGPEKDIDPNVVDGFVKRMSMKNAKMAFLSTLLGLKNAKLDQQELEKISIPIMVVWGKNDNVIPARYAKSLVPYIKGCKYVEMTNCGHTPYVEKPKEFCSIITDFFNSHQNKQKNKNYDNNNKGSQSINTHNTTTTQN